MEQLNCSIGGALNFKTTTDFVNHKQIINCQSSSLKDIIIELSES